MTDYLKEANRLILNRPGTSSGDINQVATEIPVPLFILAGLIREIETLRADVVLLKNIGPSFREIKQEIKNGPSVP